jgi:transposase
MIGTTRALRVFAYGAPADLRMGYEGLSGLVMSQLGCDVLSGDCYLFTNRTRTRAKVIFWDGTGLCILQKRLEHGRFACLWTTGKRSNAHTSIELTMSELALFIEGSEMVGRISLSPKKVVPRTLEEMRSM